MGYYLIEVKGGIIANSKIHYAQNWCSMTVGTALDEEGGYDYDSRTHTVKGDLILNENRRSVPYAIYCGNKGVCSTSDGSVCSWSGYGAALEYYKENIDKILNQINVDVAEEISQPFFRGLFTDVFSALELFLSDFMLCLIYTNEEIFEKAKVFFCTKKNESGQNVVRDIESKMHKFFFDEVVYHRFDEVKKMCKEILQGRFYKLVSTFIQVASLLGRFACLFGLFLFIFLIRSPLRIFADKEKNSQKSEANHHKLIYRTSLKLRCQILKI